MSRSSDALQRAAPALDPQRALAWRPPADWPCVETLDAHAGGEPLRIILAGWSLPQGDVLARRRHAIASQEWLRQALMWEPRGHADMYGCVVMPPVRADSHFSVLFTHNEGYSSMCGHGIIAAVTVALTCGLIAVEAPEPLIRIDSPAGLITARAQRDGRRVHHVRFQNVPGWVVTRGRTVQVEGLGPLAVDIAFGGAFYAYVDAQPLGLALTADNARPLIELGQRIKRAVAQAVPLVHPESEELAFLYGTIFVGPPADPRHHSRHACVFAQGQVDRSPTGTGVSGRCALLAEGGEIHPGERLTIESLIGSTFTVTPVERLRWRGMHAWVTEVGGSAHLTGRHTFFIDPEDPFRHGFMIR